MTKSSSTTMPSTTRSSTAAGDSQPPGANTEISDGVEMTDPYADDPAFAFHAGGKMRIEASVPLNGPEDLSLAYTPGVGRVSQAIADDPDRVWALTGRSNAVAVLSNGTAVLGLGNIGPEAAMPVMEGKAVLFKEFGDVDAYPLPNRALTAAHRDDYFYLTWRPMAMMKTSR